MGNTRNPKLMLSAKPGEDEPIKGKRMDKLQLQVQSESKLAQAWAFLERREIWQYPNASKPLET